MSSTKDAEQLLGRVLRMPYAKRRVIEDLNRAYVHLATSKFSKVTEQDVVRWLDRELRQPDVLQAQLIQFLARWIKNLLQSPNMSLTALVRNKFPLARAIADLIKLYPEKAQKTGYQASLFSSDRKVCLNFSCA